MANYKKRRSKKKFTPKDQDVKYLDKTSQDVPKNDPEWYIYDQDMFKGVISMPTLEFKGSNTAWKDNIISIDSTNSNAAKIKAMANDYFSIPTVVAYKMNPAIENEYDRTTVSIEEYSAVNVAARKIYAELSASNAKTSQYAPQDISTLILSLGQVISLAEHVKRVYGTVTHFNFYSRGVPGHIVHGMGISNYDNLRQNLSEFRARVNQIISKIDTIQFPSNLSYFKKCKYVYQNIFVDSDEKMLTYHFMTPETTWKLDEAGSAAGSVLKTTPIYDQPWQTLLVRLEEMVELILTSSTFNYIFADILNLSNRNILSVESLNVQSIPIDYTIEPLYSEQFNWQVMNMYIYPKPNATWEYVVQRDQFTPDNDVYPNADRNKLSYAPIYIATGTTTDDKYWDIMPYAKMNPVRLPSTDVSDEMFVELLAYYGYTNLEGSGRLVDDPIVILRGIPDFYCTGMVIVKPSANNINGERIFIYSNCLNFNDWGKIACHNQIVHTPFMGVFNPGNSDPDIRPISRMSAYTQVDKQAIDNLRYQTYLGLMSFKK